MNEIFTLFESDSVLPTPKLISMLDDSSLDEMFESKKFINLLDRMKIEPPKSVMMFLLSFGQSFKFLPLQRFDNKEVAAN